MYLKRLWEAKSDWMKSRPEEEAMISDVVAVDAAVRLDGFSVFKNWGIPAVWS